MWPLVTTGDDLTCLYVVGGTLIVVAVAGHGIRGVGSELERCCPAHRLVIGTSMIVLGAACIFLGLLFELYRWYTGLIIMSL